MSRDIKNINDKVAEAMEILIKAKPDATPDELVRAANLARTLIESSIEIKPEQKIINDGPFTLVCFASDNPTLHGVAGAKVYKCDQCGCSIIIAPNNQDLIKKSPNSKKICTKCFVW